MKLLLISITFILFSSCSTFAPLSEKDSTQTKIIETTLSKKAAYDKLLSYLAVNIGDSNTAVKLKNPEGPSIVFHFSDRCGKNAFLNPVNYKYSVKVDLKDKKARISSTLNSLIMDDGSKSTLYQANKDKYEGCHEGVFNMVTDALNKKSSAKSDNW